MNQLFENSSHLPLKHTMQVVDGLHSQINRAKREISIFMNASKRIEDMDIDKVSVEYLRGALKSILTELEK